MALRSTTPVLDCEVAVLDGNGNLIRVFQWDEDGEYFAEVPKNGSLKLAHRAVERQDRRVECR